MKKSELSSLPRGQGKLVLHHGTAQGPSQRDVFNPISFKTINRWTWLLINFCPTPSSPALDNIAVYTIRRIYSLFNVKINEWYKCREIVAQWHALDTQAVKKRKTCKWKWGLVKHSPEVLAQKAKGGKKEIKKEKDWRVGEFPEAMSNIWQKASYTALFWFPSTWHHNLWILLWLDLNELVDSKQNLLETSSTKQLYLPSRSSVHFLTALFCSGL